MAISTEIGSTVPSSVCWGAFYVSEVSFLIVSIYITAPNPSFYPSFEIIECEAIIVHGIGMDSQRRNKRPFQSLSPRVPGCPQLSVKRRQTSVLKP
jgi:hypothetical protein